MPDFVAKEDEEKVVVVASNGLIIRPPPSPPTSTVQWGTADAEIMVCFVENPELKGSPFKAWSRLEYSHECFTYCQGFPP